MERGFVTGSGKARERPTWSAEYRSWYPAGLRRGGWGRTYEICTKKGRSPWRPSHSMALSVMNTVSDSSAGNLVGAQVSPWSPAPG